MGSERFDRLNRAIDIVRAELGCTAPEAALVLIDKAAAIDERLDIVALEVIDGEIRFDG